MCGDLLRLAIDAISAPSLPDIMKYPRWTHLFLLCSVSFATVVSAAGSWKILDPEGRPHPRHEAAFVECNGKFYLLGGRRIQPVDIYDPQTNSWSVGKKPPVEIHHFQPVVWGNRIILAGAMTGKYPRETALPRLVIYDPAADEWTYGAEIPEGRRRGGAGAVIADGKLYLVAGIINGHWDGHVAWLDAFDLETGEWTQLPDAPHMRDHFQASAIDGKLYAGGGRRSSAKTKETFKLLEPALDIYDIKSAEWSTANAPLPEPRAGSFSIAVDGKYLVAGGESDRQQTAHDQIHAFDPLAQTWSELPQFARGRHGAGIIFYRGSLYACSGSGNRGGSPELDSLEQLKPYP
jgi:N-acetylneuraminic acid mutarotase